MGSGGGVGFSYIDPVDSLGSKQPVSTPLSTGCVRVRPNSAADSRPRVRTYPGRLRLANDLENRKWWAACRLDKPWDGSSVCPSVALARIVWQSLWRRSCVRVDASVPQSLGASREQAHFPAEQPASQPHPWFPSSDADQGRPGNRFIPPQARPCPFGRLSPAAVLAAESRLRRPDEFRDSMRKGVRCGRDTLVLHARRRSEPPSRAGFIVSKAVGKAVQRNRVKRRLRHLTAAALPSAPFPVDVVVRALPAAVSGDLAGDFAVAWRRCVDRLAA